MAAFVLTEVAVAETAVVEALAWVAMVEVTVAGVVLAVTAVEVVASDDGIGDGFGGNIASMCSSVKTLFNYYKIFRGNSVVSD